MNRTIRGALAVIILCVAMLLGLSSTSHAHHPNVSGSTTCVRDGGWVVNWTASPWASRPNLTWSIGQVSGSIPADQSFNWSEIYPASQGSASETVTGVWDNGQSGTRTGSIERPEPCPPDTTTTSTTVPSATTTSTLSPVTTTTVPVSTSSSTLPPSTSPSSSVPDTTSTTTSTTAPTTTTEPQSTTSTSSSVPPAPSTSVPPSTPTTVVVPETDPPCVPDDPNNWCYDTPPEVCLMNNGTVLEDGWEYLPNGTGEGPDEGYTRYSVAPCGPVAPPPEQCLSNYPLPPLEEGDYVEYPTDWGTTRYGIQECGPPPFAPPPDAPPAPTPELPYTGATSNVIALLAGLVLLAGVVFVVIPWWDRRREES